MDKQSKQLLVDFINQTTKQHGYAFRVLSAMDSTDEAFESAFKQLKELQVEQMKPEVEIDPPSTSTSAHDEMNIAESTDNAKENVKDNVIQFQEVKCRISGKDILRGITLNVRRGEIMGHPWKKRRRKDHTSLPHIRVAKPNVRKDHSPRGKDAYTQS